MSHLSLNAPIPFQLQIISKENPKALRELKAQHINQLVNVTGIVINSTKIIHKAVQIQVVCKNCQRPKKIDVTFVSRFNRVLVAGTFLATVTP